MPPAATGRHARSIIHCLVPAVRGTLSLAAGGSLGARARHSDGRACDLVALVCSRTLASLLCARVCVSVHEAKHITDVRGGTAELSITKPRATTECLCVQGDICDKPPDSDLDKYGRAPQYSDWDNRVDVARFGYCHVMVFANQGSLQRIALLGMIMPVPIILVGSNDSYFLYFDVPRSLEVYPFCEGALAEYTYAA